MKKSMTGLLAAAITDGMFGMNPAAAYDAGNFIARAGAAGLDTDQLDVFAKQRIKQPDCIRAAAYAGESDIGQRTGLIQHLLATLFTDN